MAFTDRDGTERVLVLISNPARPAVTETLREIVRKAVGAARAVPLDGDVAADIPLPAGAEPVEVLRAARAAVASAPADAAIVPKVGRAKRLLVADMDSTIIEQECVDELADFAGRRAEISAITERAMRGELDFEAALTERVAMLAGLSESVLQTCFNERIRLTPGAEALTAGMRAAGAACALVSGGFTFFTERVAAAAGFDRQQANVLEIEDGSLTGAVRRPILGREAKRDALIALRSELGLSPAETLAVGDGANDLAMIEEAGLGVAFRAKPAVMAAADAAIEHGDLTALLYLQGLRPAP